MSNHPHRLPAARPPARAARRTRNRWLAAGLAGAALAVGGAMLLAGAGSHRALAPTGEVNAMGMPVVATPGTAGGHAAAGGVEVTGADWALGTVPLNVAVRPAWVLRNTGSNTVTLGEPKAEVRTGCCPGPLTLGATTLAPGASTTLTFELSMHPGMAGPHDLGVHVPVSSGAAVEHLTLGVTGDFR
ncbi:MAG TPA: hypothetical protein VFJ85_17585 [Acidimicrobiales bacterium]|nr:hypothetical protein [Acidimicrobiales bacterium]